MELSAGYFDDNHHTRSMHWTYELKTWSPSSIESQQTTVAAGASAAAVNSKTRQRKKKKKTPNAQRAHAYHPFESMLAGAKISYHIQFCLFALSLASTCCLFVLDFAVCSSWPLKLFDLKWTKNLCARSFVHLAQNVPMFDYSKQFQVCGTYILMKRNERQRMNTKREKQHTSDQQIEGSHIE